jgi:hypothetical protein
MKKFTQQIFMGNCGCDCTEAQMLRVHELVDEAFELISGIQQEGCMGYAPNKERIAENGEAVEKITSQIAMALTGKKINFIEVIKVKKKDL